MDRQEERADVAHADERLRVGRDDVVVEPIEVAQREAATDEAPDGANLGVAEQLVQLMGDLRGLRRGPPPGLLDVDERRGADAEAQRLQLGEPALVHLKQVGLERAGQRRDATMSPGRSAGGRMIGGRQRHGPTVSMAGNVSRARASLSRACRVAPAIEANGPAIGEDVGKGVRIGGVGAGLEQVAGGLAADPLRDDVADPVPARALVDPERHRSIAEPGGMPVAW